MHEGHRERLRERYRKHGIDGFEKHELLELLLTYAIPRGDVNPAAHHLLETFGSMEAVFAAKPDELTSVSGVGPSCAVFLSLIGETSKILKLEKAGDRPTINTAEKASQYLTTLFSGKNTESVCILMLDGRYRLIKAELIASGSANSVLIDPRTVVQKALLHGAASVILAHNHPAGSLNPSPEDEKVTRTLSEVLKTIGINLLDHYIVTSTGCYAVNSRRIITLEQIDYFAAERER